MTCSFPTDRGFANESVNHRMDEEAERLVVQIAKENPSWGYDRIVGALANPGFLLSDRET